MTISEDNIASALIEYHRQSKNEFEEIDNTEYSIKIHPEAHYNYYGSRGVVDLYIRSDIDGDHLYEIKSESATRGATGANQIIRQFNKMRKNFFKDDSYSASNHVTFELCFTPTEYNLQHIFENIELYKSTASEEISDIDCKIKSAIVTTRSPNPENIRPIIVSDSLDLDIVQYAKRANPEIYEMNKSFFHNL